MRLTASGGEVIGPRVGGSCSTCSPRPYRDGVPAHQYHIRAQIRVPNRDNGKPALESGRRAAQAAPCGLQRG